MHFLNRCTKMATTIVLLLVFLQKVLCFNIETQLDLWCQEPMKTVDFQGFNSRINKKFYQNLLDHRCGIRMKHVPRKIWNENLTELFKEPFTSELSVLKISDGLKVVDQNFFKLEAKLKHLDLSGNGLDYLPLPKEDNNFLLMQNNIFDHLFALDLSKNKFRNLSFVQNKIFNLRELDLSENEFKKLPTNSLFEFVDLEKVSFKKNNIKLIESSKKNSYVKYLDLSENHLKDFVGCEKFIRLKILLLSFNDIEILHADTFKDGIWSLEELHLDHNKITDVSSDFFGYFPNLKSLKLNNNRLLNLRLNVFSTLKFLENFDVSNNFLTSLNDDLFKSKKNLVTINIRNNSINSFNFTLLSELCSGLREIDIMDNNFSCFYFDIMFSFFAEKNIFIPNGELCLPPANEKICCNKNSVTTPTTFEVATKKIKSDFANLILNNNSYDISKFFSTMERKSESFLTLFFYQFAFIVSASSLALVVYLYRNCGTKKSNDEKNSELHKMIQSV